jgi:hypothetical protein
VENAPPPADRPAVFLAAEADREQVVGHPLPHGCRGNEGDANQDRENEYDRRAFQDLPPPYYSRLYI